MFEMFLEALLFKEGVLIGILFWMLVFCLVPVVWLLAGVIICMCKSIYVWVNTKDTLEERVVAIVTEKEYEQGYTSMMSTGKCSVPIHHSASYNVYLEYDGEEFVFDDEELYKRVKKKDKVPAKLIKYIDKNGKVLDTDLEIDS